MKKVGLKKIVGILCLLLVVIIGTTGCGTSNHNVQEIVSSQDTASREEILPDQDGNPYSTHKIIDGETVVTYDYSEAYKKLDLSQYTEYGKFGDDGIIWVEKSDYTGTQFGYIDYNGNFIIPLTSDIKMPGEFISGFVPVVYDIDFSEYKCNFLNTKGEVIFSYITRDDEFADIKAFNKDIIIFKELRSASFPTTLDRLYNSYVYFVKTNKLIGISDGYFHWEEFSFSDCLLKTVGSIELNGEKNLFFEFYNDNGEIELRIDEKTNEYYTSICDVDKFVDGKSSVTFVGKDECKYKVTIDKKGNWLDDPVAIHND